MPVIMIFSMIVVDCHNIFLYNYSVEYINRILNLKSRLEKKSHFLFGARQTGKSTIIKNDLSKYRCYDLLDSETYLTLNMNPKQLEQEIT